MTEDDLNTRDLDETDADRLLLLDRIAKRMPEVKLDRHEIEWTTLPDGSEALLVDGGGVDGGKGSYLANAGEDVHAVGSVDPLIEGHIGCVVIAADGTRRLAHVVPDPMAQHPDS